MGKGRVLITIKDDVQHVELREPEDAAFMPLNYTGLSYTHWRNKPWIVWRHGNIEYYAQNENIARSRLNDRTSHIRNADDMVQKRRKYE